MEQQIEYLAAIREAVGDKTDIILECHGRYDPQWAIELAKRAEPYKPFLIEDPIRHENPQALAEVRASTRIPLASENPHMSGSLVVPRIPIWMIRRGSSKPSSTARRNGAPW